MKGEKEETSRRDGSLPAWPGAEVCYERAYRLLAWMGRNGHVQLVPIPSRGARGRRVQSVPSAEMRAVVEALARGNEEEIKGILLRYLDQILEGENNGQSA